MIPSSVYAIDNNLTMNRPGTTANVEDELIADEVEADSTMAQDSDCEGTPCFK